MTAPSPSSHTAMRQRIILSLSLGTAFCLGAGLTVLASWLNEPRYQLNLSRAEYYILEEALVVVDVEVMDTAAPRATAMRFFDHFRDEWNRLEPDCGLVGWDGDDRGELRIRRRPQDGLRWTAGMHISLTRMWDVPPRARLLVYVVKGQDDGDLPVLDRQRSFAWAWKEIAPSLAQAASAAGERMKATVRVVHPLPNHGIAAGGTQNPPVVKLP